MLIHNIDPIAFNFFIFEIRWYSLAYIFGILLGWYYAKKIINRLKYSNNNFRTLNTKDFDDLIPYLVLGIILGGRLGYVFIYNLEYYSENLTKIFFKIAVTKQTFGTFENSNSFYWKNAV